MLKGCAWIFTIMVVAGVAARIIDWVVKNPAATAGLVILLVIVGGGGLYLYREAQKDGTAASVRQDGPVASVPRADRSAAGRPGATYLNGASQVTCPSCRRACNADFLASRMAPCDRCSHPIALSVDRSGRMCFRRIADDRAVLIALGVALGPDPGQMVDQVVGLIEAHIHQERRRWQISQLRAGGITAIEVWVPPGTTCRPCRVLAGREVPIEKLAALPPEECVCLRCWCSYSPSAPLVEADRWHAQHPLFGD